MSVWPIVKLAEKAREVIQLETEALRLVAEQLDPETLDQITQSMLACTGHILVAGAGTSHAVAVRFAHLLACCGTPALPINAADALHGAAGAVKTGDILFVISKGGKSQEINKFVDIAKSRGAKIIAQTECADSPLAAKSDIIYHIVTPTNADPYGMIATASSLVNALAGDILCTLLLEMRGYSQEEFGFTHPEGAVGVRLQGDNRQATFIK